MTVGNEMKVLKKEKFKPFSPEEFHQIVMEMDAIHLMKNHDYAGGDYM